MSSDPAIDREARRLYEKVVQQATGYAQYHVDIRQARDVAHDVAVDIVKSRTADPKAFEKRPLTGALIRRSVLNRIGNERRGAGRRDRKHSAYIEDPTVRASDWRDDVTDPRVQLMEHYTAAALERMAKGSRQVYLLAREHQMTYKQIAKLLGITVGTVHTHLSRASDVLGRVAKEYLAAAEEARAAESLPALPPAPGGAPAPAPAPSALANLIRHLLSEPRSS